MDTQKAYKIQRKTRSTTINISSITGVCKRCGFVELAPTTELEEGNGSLMVSRKGLTILNESGRAINKLKNTSTRNINEYWGCNYCVNKW